MRTFSKMMMAMVLIVVSMLPLQAQEHSAYEGQLTQNFAAYVNVLVERRTGDAVPEDERTPILVAYERFATALEDQGLYQAHLVWLNELGALLLPRNPAEGWDGVPRMTEGQYRQVIALVAQAEERTRNSGEMMEDGRRSVHEYYFRPFRENRPDYAMLQLQDLITDDTEQVTNRLWAWLRMVGVASLLEVRPPVASIVEAAELEARADEAEARADEVEARADEAEALAAALSRAACALDPSSCE